MQTVEPLDAHSRQFMKFSENDVFLRTSWRTLPDSLMLLQETDFTDLLQIRQKMLQQPKENEEQLKLICVNEERID